MLITRKGVPTPVEGNLPEIGTKAPDFALPNQDDTVVRLSDLSGKTVLITVFPDINTSVCDRQTRSFFTRAAEIPEVKIINISNNTKEQLADWCATHGIDSEMLRDENRSFAHAYGLWMPEFKVLARSVFVINAEGTLVYSELCPEMAQDPDYDGAIEAALNA